MVFRLLQYFCEVLANAFRSAKTVFKYRATYVSTGVAIGKGCSFGQGVKIYRNCIVANTVIGDFSYIGGGSQLKNCTIGKFCSLGQNIQVGLGIHPVDRISTYPGFYSSKASGVTNFGTDQSIDEILPVTVGSDVWIGNNSLIMDGVEIGNGAVIAAGSVVTKSVPPYAVVAGVPAKTIRMRFVQEQIDFLEDFRWWEKGEEFCRENAELFLKPEEFLRKFWK